jgi:type IV secretory pathway VirB2 component (pilin)
MQNFFEVSIAHAGTISDAPSIASVLQNVVNFLLSIIGVLAIIAVVISGLMYLTANGDPKQAEVAKKILFYAIIGAVVAFGAMVIISQLGSFFVG